MSDVHVLAIDLAKRSFQVCATDPGGAVLFNRAISRAKLIQLLTSQPPCIVAMEACATSHYWGRVAQGFGHQVRLVPPIYVKPFVKRQKNDAADAAAIAEAALRPNMHYVAVKSAEHQARAVAFRTHQCFIRQRTQLINALRGHLAEFGLVVAQGPAHLKQVTELMEAGTEEVPDTVKEIVHLYLDQIEHLTQKIEELTRQLQDATRESAEMRRLCSAPGVGPVTAGAIMAFAPDLHAFFKRQELRRLAGPCAQATLDRGQDAARRRQQDGADRHSQAADHRCHEPDPMDHSQGRHAGQLAWAAACPQAAHGCRRRLGEQDGSQHLGDDDEGAELQDGVSGTSSSEGG